MAASSNCTLISQDAIDPILSDLSKERGGHRIGSRAVVPMSLIRLQEMLHVTDAIKNDEKPQIRLTSEVYPSTSSASDYIPVM